MNNSKDLEETVLDKATITPKEKEDTSEEDTSKANGLDNLLESQRSAFIKWYGENGSEYSANTISTALSKTKLKNGTPIFGITIYNDLNEIIETAGLSKYFHIQDGDYSKMDAIFEYEASIQKDDLKSGIKYYLKFLKSKEDLTKRKIKEENLYSKMEEKFATTIPKNLILYGAPGTGKTYSSIQYAVAIIENKDFSKVKEDDYSDVYRRYLKYIERGLIAFTTFHQSFGYEEFIEGIRPVISSEGEIKSEGGIKYKLHDGIFKDFCEKGINKDLDIKENANVWRVSLEGTGTNDTRTECLKNNHIRIGYDKYGENLPDVFEIGNSGKNTLNIFYNKMKIGDIVFSCYSSREIDAIGIITGDPEWHEEYKAYKRLRTVNWLEKDFVYDVYELNNNRLMTTQAVHELNVKVDEIPKLISEIRLKNGSRNRVFIIDEINRGNISKIFGELITLIEPTKRIGGSEELRAILPYSGIEFGVPGNIYIIGTMNTADRSITRIDSALRRRFNFIEMLPESETLKDIVIDGIKIKEVLDTINKRITVLLDREHTIGHSYFLQPLKSEASIERLAKIFEYEIIPLLQEYFYDDYEKIQLVLGDNQKPDDSTRFIIKRTDARKLFGASDADFADYYEINSLAFKNRDAYAYIK